MSLEHSDKEFVQLLLEHSEISSRLSAKKIRELASVHYQLRNVDKIYNAVKQQARPKKTYGKKGKRI